MSQLDMKKVLCAMPLGLLATVDEVAKREHRNRSDLMREALRHYIAEAKRRQNEEAYANLHRMQGLA